jgi:Flp pilus assembly protein TadG
MKLWRRILQAINRRFTREAGSSSIELAIVLPVLVLLFVGATELGRLFYTYTTLAKATKVGARYLSRSIDATSSNATTQSNEFARAKSLVVCGVPNLDCTGQTPILKGLTPSNVRVAFSTQMEGTVNVQYVKVDIINYTYQPGPFNLAAWTGNANSKFYFGLTPATTMRYMLG